MSKRTRACGVGARASALFHADGCPRQVRIKTGGGRSDHSCARQHRVFRGRLDHGASCSIRIKLHQQRVLQMPAGDMQGIDAIAAIVERLEDMPNAERYRDRCPSVKLAQAVDRGLQCAPGFGGDDDGALAFFAKPALDLDQGCFGDVEDRRVQPRVAWRHLGKRLLEPMG